MRKFVVLLASMALAVFLACGVAVALSVVHCSDPGAVTDGWCMGTEEDDTIYGTIRTDLIDGRGGDDTIHAYDANDTVVDREGRNRAYGGGGDDRLGVRGSAIGQAGGDLIRLVNWGTARGGTGNDSIDAHNESRNRVWCGAGRDKVYFDRGLDTLAEGCERRIPHEVPID